MSRPTVSKAQTSYPIFAASFASNKPGCLVVGGGGGGGRHGVKNKITLFDFSSRAPTVEPSAEIVASEDDSVTCLANLATKDGLILYAGINGSEEDRLSNRNEHFQAFEVQLPKGTSRTSSEKGSGGAISYLSKTALFAPVKSAPAKKEGYQRLVRLSPPARTASTTPTKRIGAIASSLAGDENEIVVFSATSNKPQNPNDVIQRIQLSKGQEANDLDIVDRGEGHFQVAYVVDHDVYVQQIKYDFGQRKSKGANERRKLYTIPHTDALEKKARPKLRCIRWLTPEHLLLLVNKPNRTGVDMLVVHMYEEGPGSIIQRKTLPKRIKAATDMDVALLDADSNGAYQIAVCVAAIDISLSVYTIDYNGRARNSLGSFYPFAIYDNVHEVQMTKAVFSPFYKPEGPAATKGGPHYLRLASTSLGNTVSVETFELQPFNSRHVLQTARARNMYAAAMYLLAAMVVAAVALMVQSLIDPHGNLTKAIVPPSLQNAAGRYRPMGEVVREKRHKAVLNNAESPIVKTVHRIQDLLHLHKSDLASDQQKALVIHHDSESGSSLSTEVHDDPEDVIRERTQAKKWEELSQEEQKFWRQKLSDAGVWAASEGETILKSIFFGNVAGLVGAAARGVIG